MQHLLDIRPAELQAWFEQRDIPRYRARQIQSWLFRQRADQFEQMTDLPASLRGELAESFTFWSTQIEKHSSANDGTEKLLLGLAAGGQIECVLLRDGARRSICISSQVGCAMGCVFCASGLHGVDRNLTTGEIIEQALRLQQLLPLDERLSHIVVMGMGEPLANLDAVLPALELLSHADGLGISARRITISTVGVPAAIKRLSGLNSRYELAVSLHAPNDTLRNRLVPVNDRIGLEAILSAADEYFEVSGRRLTYEYVLLANVNDGPHHADELASLLRGRPALLNLIPYNPVSGLPYRSPSRAAVERFRGVLEKGGINVQVRKRKGNRINAACGQLRHNAANIVDASALAADKKLGAR